MSKSSAVVSADSSPFSRSLVRAIENTGYYKVVALPRTVDEAEQLLAEVVAKLAADLEAAAVGQRDLEQNEVWPPFPR